MCFETVFASKLTAKGMMMASSIVVLARGCQVVQQHSLVDVGQSGTTSVRGDGVARAQTVSKGFDEWTVG